MNLAEMVNTRRNTMSEMDKLRQLKEAANAAKAQIAQRSAQQASPSVTAKAESTKRQLEQLRRAQQPSSPVTVKAEDAKARLEAMRQSVAQSQAGYDDDYEIARRAMEDPAQLRQDILSRVQQANQYDDAFKEIYPRSGVIDTAKGIGQGIKIGLTEQFPAGMAGAVTGAQEGLGNFWRMVNTPAKNGEINYEPYVSPLRDDAQRMAAKAQKASAENLEGRGPAAERLIGVSQAAGNMLPAAAIGGVGAAAGLSNLTTALIGAGAGGSSYIDAVTQGAGVGEAAAYGLLSGAAEAFTERLFGGNPLADAKPGLVNGLIKKIGGSDKLMRYLASRPVETLNEGMEEAIVTVMQPIFQRLTYDPNADLATLEQIADSAIDGVLLAGIMQGGSAAIRSAGNVGGKPSASRTAAGETEAATDAPEFVNNFAAATEGESTSVDTNPATHTVAEMNVINDYQDAVDEELVKFYQESKQNTTGRGYRLKDVTDRAAQKIKELVDRDVFGFKTIIDRRQAWHINNDHGAQGKSDRSMQDDNDVGRIQYVLDNFDNAEYGGTTDAYWEPKPNGKSRQAQVVVFSKKVNGTYYVVEAAPVTKAKSVYVVSAYMLADGKTPPGRRRKRKTETPSQPPDANAPWFTANTDSANNVSANTNINGDGENVKTTPEGMGAASLGFDPYSNLLNRYGAIPEGENPARIVDVPMQTTDTDRVSRTARTAMEAGATPEELLENMQEATIRGDFSYVPITNAQLGAKAEAMLAREGWSNTLEHWKRRVSKGKTDADTVVLGWTLYNNAANAYAESARSGRPDAEKARTAMDILTSMATVQRQNAQALQAQRMLKKMQPEHRLFAIERSLNSINEELREKHGKEVKLSPELYSEFLAADTPEAADAALDRIYRHIAGQIPPTLGERLRAWRYVAMLGNLKTQARNIVGNSGMLTIAGAKNIVAGGIEAAAARLNPGMPRQRSLLNIASAKDRALIKQSADLFDSVEAAVLGSGRNADYLQRGSGVDKVNPVVEKYRQENVFRDANPVVNTLLAPARAYRALTTWAMESGDSLFAKPAFTTALASWLKANGFVADDISQNRIDRNTLDKAVAFAVEEARQQVFRDHNQFSDLVSGLKNHRNTTAVKAVNAAVDILLPFRRTPANVAVRMYEYSPLSAASIVADGIKLHRGEITAAEFIDTIAKTATGSLLTAAGFMLAKQGVLHASGDDDEKQAEFDAMQGIQEYSLDLGGRNYTIDSLAPASVPLFIGAELWQQFAANEGYKDMDTWDFYNAAIKSFNPLEQMSMISGLTEVVADIDEEQGMVASVVTTAAKNYVSQFIPTLFGQIERTAEGGERRQTYIDRDSETPTSIQYTLAGIANKLPGEVGQVPYIDQWGRRESTGSKARTAGENFVTPWYSKEIRTTEVDRKLQELYSKGYNVLPGLASKTTKVEGGNLSGEEYTKYAQERGEKSYALAEILLDGYGSLEETERAAAIEKAYDFAEQYGKAKAAGYEPDKWVQEYTDAGDGEIADMVVYKALEKTYTGRELIDKLESAGIDDDVVMSAQSDKRQETWENSLKGTGISAYDVLDIQYMYNNTAGEGRKEKVVDYINSKALTAAQKREVYLYLGYAESKMPDWK